jgi:hypothetical protein
LAPSAKSVDFRGPRRKGGAEPVSMEPPGG